MSKRRRNRRQAFLMDELVVKRLSVAAVSRRVWPNKLVEEALEMWFEANSIDQNGLPKVAADAADANG